MHSLHLWCWGARSRRSAQMTLSSWSSLPPNGPISLGTPDYWSCWSTFLWSCPSGKICWSSRTTIWDISHSKLCAYTLGGCPAIPRRERIFSRSCRANISRETPVFTSCVDSKWRIFSRWCSEQSVDPFQISIQKLADFFLFLFHEKGLNPRTIKGYRSAISSTISSCGSRTEFTNSPELASLIRSFQLERPPQRKIAPQWNLSLFLQPH